MKYKATGTIVWEFESSSINDAQIIAEQHFKSIPNIHPTEIRTLCLDKLKEKIEKVRVAEFKMDDVLPFISHDAKKDYIYDGITYSVKLNSQRYFVFRDCMQCASCKLPITKIFLEYHPGDNVPHFNLYGEEYGNLILMTKDHIHAKSEGGEDIHSNYQTMCMTCNSLKGNSNLSLESIAFLRLLHENKNKLTKKKLHVLIEETRANLSMPWIKQKPKKMKFDSIKTLVDINVYKGSEIYGLCVYDAIPNDELIGCIRKDTVLEPLLSIKDKIICKIQGNDVLALHKSLVKSKD